MGLVIGVTGTATEDFFFDPSRFSLEGGVYRISAGGREFRVEPDAAPERHGKVFARFDRELLHYADRKQFGGGGYNSASVMAAIAPDVEIRYSDSGTPNAELEADLVGRGVACRFRGLHPAQANIVTGDASGSDKQIFKSQIPPHAVPIPSDDDGPWVAAGGTVLVNSDKHRPFVTRLAAGAARGLLNMHVVLTPSQRPDYLMGAVVPYAKVIIAALDELEAALGIAVRRGVDGGAVAVRMLAECASSPIVHLTLGRDGVLLTNPEDMTILHVRLSRGKDREVQRGLRDHSGVCGCGDSYAAAVTLYSVAGRSVFGASPLGPDTFVSAALAGCGAALRHLGFAGPLGPEDFVVDEVGLLARACGE